MKYIEITVIAKDNLDALKKTEDILRRAYVRVLHQVRLEEPCPPPWGGYVMKIGIDDLTPHIVKDNKPSSSGD